MLAAHAARARGRAIRLAYRAALPAVVRRAVDVRHELPCAVFSFSSRADLPEQIASVRSFLRHAGRPRSYTVVSDGSHDERSRRLLRAIDRCVRVAELPQILRPRLPPAVRRQAAMHAMGAKLALELSLPAGGPVVYADADVLFGAGAHDELAGKLAAGGPPWFLPDCEPYLDRRLVTRAEARLRPVNGGFFVLFAALEWDRALARLARIDRPVFHTEQTLLHLAMHASGGRPLDGERFVVDTDDMLAWRSRHRHATLALRHYTTPVRHRLWAAVAGT
jgi:hypothetical protein